MGNPRTVTDLDAPARSIMASATIETGPEATLREVIDLLAENDIGTVPVIDPRDRKLIGIMGERDLVRAMSDGVDIDVERVGDVMVFDTSTLHASTTIRQAASMMIEGGIRHLPLVDDDNSLRGILSIRDLLAAYAAVAR